MRRKSIALVATGLLVLGACSSGPDQAGQTSSAATTSPSVSESAAASTTTAPSTLPASTTTVPPAPVTCDSDDDLASIETLLRSGQPVYDYQPARDLAQLVEWAEVVVTGTIASVDRVGEYAVFAVTDVERLAGTGTVEQISAPSVWAGGQGPDPLGDAVEFDGLAFIAFLEDVPDTPSGWTPSVEGLGFACSPTSTSTASLAGLTKGTAGLSLDEIADEVRAVAAGVPGAGTLGITRPVFDDSICAAQSAGTGEFEGDLTFFAQSSDAPVTVQVIAEPETTPADPFAVLLRYPVGAWRYEGGEPIDVGGRLVSLRVFENGNGAATWDIPDGSTGYLRSRGLNEDDLVEIIESLVPAPLDAPYPGFSIETGGEPSRFQSLHEGVDTDVHGSTASSECAAAGSDFWYRLAAVEGDPVFVYGAVIDNHVPLEVGYREGTVLVLHGPDVAGAPTIADVVNADLGEWERLLGQPDLSLVEGARDQSISEGIEVVAQVNDITGPEPVPTGFYIVQLTVAEGVSFVQVSSGNVEFHPDAVFETIEINGRPRSRSTVTQDSTHGVRVADTSTPEPFVISIAVTDETGEPVQRSETIRLLPE